jgi:hypothetical protein
VVRDLLAGLKTGEVMCDPDGCVGRKAGGAGVLTVGPPKRQAPVVCDPMQSRPGITFENR